MKKYQLGYYEGWKAMEKEHQKKIYVSQLERQHQLQHIQVNKKKIFFFLSFFVSNFSYYLY